MIFVTGGTGLVGAHVLLNLSQKKKRFKAFKRESSSLKVCESIFGYYEAQDLFSKIEWVDGDINDIPSLQRGMKECDHVLHIAGIVSFDPNDINLVNKVNIEGTANIINVAIDAGIKKIGYVSSIAALGKHTDKSIIDEECHFKKTNTESNYAYSKYYAEQEVWRASQEGVDVVIINPSVILGPGDWNKGSSKIFQRIHQGLKFYTEGTTGYVDVVDVAEILLILFFSKIKNERFIVNAINLPIRDCFDKIAIEFNKPKATIKVTPILKSLAWRIEYMRSLFTGEKPLLTRETANSAIKKVAFSSNKLIKEIDFKFIDIDDTISKYCKWYLKDLD
tara:strand:- start:155 stop:1159 length:1005 start_codon:yes stop_codon:yes gene_type:complete